MLTKEEAREKFKQADLLFNQKDYAGSLKLLTELNAAFPNQKNILYPMARSLTGLGRNSEAIDLADRIARQFDYPPALELYKRLKARTSKDGIGLNDSSSGFQLPSGGPKLDSDPIGPIPGAPDSNGGGAVLPSNLDSLIEGPRSAPPPLPARASGSPWKSYALWGGLVLGGYVIMLMITPPMWEPISNWWSDIQANVDKYESDPSLEPAFPVNALRMVMFAWTLYWYLPTCLCAYLALYITDSLLFGDFSENMKDVAKYNAAGTLLSMVPLFGWIAILVLIKKHYDLPYLRLMGTVMLYEVFSFGLGIVFGGVAFLVLV